MSIAITPCLLGLQKLANLLCLREEEGTYRRVTSLFWSRLHRQWVDLVYCWQGHLSIPILCPVIWLLWEGLGEAEGRVGVGIREGVRKEISDFSQDNFS